VRRTFAEYLSGKGDRPIANGLDGDGILCPSARRPHQNRHRLAGRHSAGDPGEPSIHRLCVLRSLYQYEALLDPDDVAAKLTRFQDAIKAGVDPAALVEAINEAHVGTPGGRLQPARCRRVGWGSSITPAWFSVGVRKVSLQDHV
jgi:hypothetical protein